SILDPFEADTDIDRDLAPRPGDRRFNDAVRGEFERAAIQRWIEAQDGRPYFLFLHTYAIHDYYAPAAMAASFAGASSAVLPPGRDLRRLDQEFSSAGRPPSPDVLEACRGLYDSCVAAVDVEVGALLDWLRASGRFESTVIAIVSDHGEEHGEHGGL